MQLDSTIGILGFGVEGESTFRHLVREGAKSIVILDKRNVTLSEIPNGVSVKVSSGEGYLDALKDCSMVVRSAGVYPMLPELLKFQMDGGNLTSQAEIFFENFKGVTIGVTGTLGKGSCVSMIRHILDTVKIPCKLGGNFGVPMLDLLAQNTDAFIAILELSSFQLMTLGSSPRVGVVLRVSTEHLDWHKGVEEYRDAKANLVRWQRRSDACIFMNDSEPSRRIAKCSQAQKFSFGHAEGSNAKISEAELSIGSETLRLSACKIRGSYQLENMAAAALATRALGVSVRDAFEALKTYEALPLRMEFRGEISGIEFYNDSYATRPDATIAAVKSMKRPFSLILGGSEKNADFTEMFSEIAGLDKLRKIEFIGATACRMKECAEAVGVTVPMKIFPNLGEAFDSAVEIGAGGSVLLSPACASFGLFKNYKERGASFNKLIEDFQAKNV